MASEEGRRRPSPVLRPAGERRFDEADADRAGQGVPRPGRPRAAAPVVDDHPAGAAGACVCDLVEPSGARNPP